MMGFLVDVGQLGCSIGREWVESVLPEWIAWVGWLWVRGWVELVWLEGLGR